MSNIAEPFPKPLLISLWILAIAITFKLFNQLTADYDLWFHLFIGQENLTHAHIGRIDIYSFTAFGLPVINHEWFADLIMTGAYKLLGQTGLILWRWLMVFAIIFLGILIIKKRAVNPLSQIVTYLCFVIVLAPGVAFRVQLFSYAFLLILLKVIYDKRIQGSSHAIIVIIVFLFWANIHGAFFLGLLILYIHLWEYCYIDKNEVSLVAIFFLFTIPTVVTLINPYGIGLWQFIFNELSNPISSQHITEWRHFSFEARELPFFLIFVMTWTAYFISGKEKKASETIVLVLSSIMGFMAVRHTPLFVVLNLPSIAYHFDGLLNKLNNKSKSQRPTSKPLIYFASFIILLAALLFFIYGASRPWRIQIDQDPLPIRSVAFIKYNNFKGNLWTPLHWGAYALFHLYPNIKVSIDGRWAMLYPHDVMKANMDFAYHGDRGRWKKILEKYKADYALVENTNPALLEMKQDSDWVLGLVERTCSLFIKKEKIVSHHSPIIIPNIEVDALP